MLKSDLPKKHPDYFCPEREAVSALRSAEHFKEKGKSKNAKIQIVEIYTDFLLPSIKLQATFLRKIVSKGKVKIQT